MLASHERRDASSLSLGRPETASVANCLNVILQLPVAGKGAVPVVGIEENLEARDQHRNGIILLSRHEALRSVGWSAS
jgi:hypothetical protein